MISVGNGALLARRLSLGVTRAIGAGEHRRWGHFPGAVHEAVEPGALKGLPLILSSRTISTPIAPNNRQFACRQSC